MKINVVILFVYFHINVPITDLVQLDLIDCGIDHEPTVTEGLVPNEMYPWLGILFYTYYGELGETRAVTTVALVQSEFVVAVSADIGPMPKRDFRQKARVLLGEGWEGRGRRVRNYVIHPHYGETLNTVALIQLKHPVRDTRIKPLCPPPERLKNPKFYIMKFDEDYTTLQKKVIPMEHVPASLCRQFYITANLYETKMRPPHVTCSLSFESLMPCVWNAGAALVARDVWGRWQLLGLGVRGPGCGAPSRYLDMMSYYPWIESSLAKFQRITISKINNHKYVLRARAFGSVMQRFGDCDEGEMINLIYREVIVLRTDNNNYQFATYNLTILDAVDYTCLTLELINASASSELRMSHLCPREGYGLPCHHYKSSIFDISVYFMFSDKCSFEMKAWGFHKNMSLLDVQEWKWEEGTYYEDFTMTAVEYKGPTHMTEFGFEPADLKYWVPDYDVWTTTEPDNSSWSSTTPKQNLSDADAPTGYHYYVTTLLPPRTRKRFHLKTTTTTTTTRKPRGWFRYW